jgi:curved DNA-binding protein CbpA
MSDDTYYTVLGIPETATQDEIKRAYRDSIRLAHPDKFPNASPEWKLAVEGKSKEIIEAYHVLSNSAQRSCYDRQLAQYRRQNARATPPRGTKAAATSPPRSYTSPPNSAPQQQFNWAAFAGILILVAPWYMLFVTVDDSNKPQPFQRNAAVATVIQQEGGSLEPLRTESKYRLEDVASYCKTHPTSFYGAPGVLGVSCSDPAHKNQWSWVGPIEQASYVEARQFYLRNNPDKADWKPRADKACLSSDVYFDEDDGAKMKNCSDRPWKPQQAPQRLRSPYLLHQLWSKTCPIVVKASLSCSTEFPQQSLPRRSTTMARP